MNYVDSIDNSTRKLQLLMYLQVQVFISGSELFHWSINYGIEQSSMG